MNQNKIEAKRFIERYWSVGILDQSYDTPDVETIMVKEIA